MGYELKMYVVSRHEGFSSTLCLVDGVVYPCFEKEIDKMKTMIYYPDHNTKTKVPADAIIKTGNAWCEVVGMVELCKCGDFGPTGICKFEDSDGDYMYSIDGDNYIGLDCYGSYRRFVPINEVIDTLKAKEEEGYRRFEIALSFLKSVKKNFKGEQVGCMFYGH